MNAGVAKSNGPDVEPIIAAQGYGSTGNKEATVLAKIIGDDEPVISRAILKDNDRIRSVTYAESAEVKLYFLALKESLLA